jgi:hypothetical protein
VNLNTTGTLRQLSLAYLVSWGLFHATAHGLAVGVPVLPFGAEVNPARIAVDAFGALLLPPHGALHDATVGTELPALSARPIEGLPPA